jgi:thioredoxin reductase
MNGTEIVAAHGNGHLERIDVRNAQTGETRSLAASALFIFIGVAPHTEALRRWWQPTIRGSSSRAPTRKRPGRVGASTATR